MNNAKPINKTYKTLQIGQVFKNYKDLCNFLHQPVTGGKSKKYQLEMFNRYFDYRKDGYKFIITDVFEQSLIHFDKGLYQSLIQKLLLDYLVNELQKGNKTTTLTYNNLIDITGIANHNYIEHRKDVRTKYNHNSEHDTNISNLLNVNDSIVKEFYEVTYSKIRNTLKRSIENLANRMVILKEESYTCIVETNNIKHTHNMTEEEKHIYLLAIDSVVESLGLTEYFQVFQYYKEVEFNKRIQEYMNKHIKGFQYAFKSYKLYFNINIIKEQNRVNQFLLKNKDDLKLMLSDTMGNKHMESVGKKVEHMKVDEDSKTEIIKGNQKLVNYTIKQ